MDVYSTGYFVNIFSMGNKHSRKYVIEGQHYNSGSSLVDREEEQTIWCCCARR